MEDLSLEVSEVFYEGLVKYGGLVEGKISGLNVFLMTIQFSVPILNSKVVLQHPHEEQAPIKIKMHGRILQDISSKIDSSE